MYKYINPKGKFIIEYLELGGRELVFDLLKMIPEDYGNRIKILEKAVKEFDYPSIQMEVHTIKANFRQIVEIDHDFMVFIQRFEDESRIVAEKAETNEPIQTDIDFSENFERFRRESDLVVEEIEHFADHLN